MSVHTLHGSTFTGYELAPEVSGYRYHVGGYVATVEEARKKLNELREIVSAGELRACKVCGYNSSEVLIVNDLCSVHTCQTCGAEGYAVSSGAIVCADHEIIWSSAITRAMVEELTPEQIEGLTHELDNAVMNLFDELKGE